MAHQFDAALNRTVRIGVVGPRAAGKSSLIWNMLAFLGNDLSSEPISVRSNISPEEFVACKRSGNLAPFSAGQEFSETKGTYRLPDTSHNVSKFKICFVDTPGFRVDAPASAVAFECGRVFQGCYKDCVGKETIPLYPGEGMDERAGTPSGGAPLGRAFQASMKDYLVYSPQSLIFDPVRVPFSRSQYAMDVLLVVTQLDPSAASELEAARAVQNRWTAINAVLDSSNGGHSSVIPAVHVLTHVDCLVEASAEDDYAQLRESVQAECTLGAISYRTTAHGGHAPIGVGAPDSAKYLRILHTCLLKAEQAWLQRRIEGVFVVFPWEETLFDGGSYPTTDTADVPN